MKVTTLHINVRRGAIRVRLRLMFRSLDNVELDAVGARADVRTEDFREETPASLTLHDRLKLLHFE
jgi:hypothetical protein